MKKTLLNVALISAMGFTAQATSAATLSIAGSNASWFTMGQANGLPPALAGTTGQYIVTGTTGVVVDGVTTQLATGGNPGAPDGLGTTPIDAEWTFYTNTGVHRTTSPINVLSNDNAGNVTLDFSGWAVNWSSVANIPMGSGAWGTNASGVALMTCASTCGNGDTYTINYTATVPPGDPSNFGGTKYELHMTGTISGTLPVAVPVPAAVWLFGSGLIGLVGVARRKKVA